MMKDMKARMMMIIMAVALVALPTMAQQEWQSTSAMQGSGSAYGAQVTAVGATEVVSEATTTETYSPSNNRPHRAKKFDTGADGNQSSESPIGDALMPLMLMALAFGGYIAIKRRKLTANN